MILRKKPPKGGFFYPRGKRPPKDGFFGAFQTPTSRLTVIPVKTGIHRDAIGFRLTAMSAFRWHAGAHIDETLTHGGAPGRWAPAFTGATGAVSDTGAAKRAKKKPPFGGFF